MLDSLPESGPQLYFCNFGQDADTARISNKACSPVNIDILLLFIIPV